MSSFLTYFQPSIVRLSDDVCIPKSLQNKYVLNINAMGISWFEENFILSEDATGNKYLAVDELTDDNLLLESSGSNKFDLPRIYVVLNDDFNDNLLSTFTATALSKPETYGDGITGFRPGRDYYVNETLKYWLGRNLIGENNADYVLPDYLVQDGNTMKMSEYFQELPESEVNSVDIKRFIKKNAILSLSFDEDKLRNFASTFFGCILKYSTITSENKLLPRNQIYNRVMEYYRDGKSDNTTISLQLILGTKAKMSEQWMNSTSSCNTCFNTSGSSSAVSLQPACLALYMDAMEDWIKEMLADTNFYKDWMFVTDSDNTYPNVSLIDLLITLIQDYIKSGFPLSKQIDDIVNCNSCPSLDSSYSQDECNKNIMLNYIKVLEWAKACQLKQNKNKIKVYGQEFAQLLNDVFYE